MVIFLCVAPLLFMPCETAKQAKRDSEEQLCHLGCENLIRILCHHLSMDKHFSTGFTQRAIDRKVGGESARTKTVGDPFSIERDPCAVFTQLITE